jgi:hypothetical protein
VFFVYVCMRVYVYVFMYAEKCISPSLNRMKPVEMDGFVHTVCMYVCMYMCMYVC